MERGSMTNESPTEGNRRLEQLLSAPEIYVDGYHGVSVANGVAKLNFFTTAFDPQTEKISKVAALRLTCSMSVLVAIYEALGQTLTDLEKQGIMQRAEMKPTDGKNA